MNLASEPSNLAAKSIISENRIKLYPEQTIAKSTASLMANLNEFLSAFESPCNQRTFKQSEEVQGLVDTQISELKSTKINRIHILVTVVWTPYNKSKVMTLI